MTRVVVVDDSRTARIALRAALEREPDMEVVGETATEQGALSLIARTKPDVVTMDVHLGSADGIDVVRAIMRESPRPILVVTGVDPDDPALAYRAVKAGAVDVTGKLPGPARPEYEERRQQFVRLVRAVSRVPVVRKRFGPRAHHASRPAPPRSQPRVTVSRANTARPRVLLIGASTGGPPVVAALLSAMRGPLPVAVVVLQHIAAGFANGLAKWLQSTTGHRTVAVDRIIAIEPATVYLAADQRHLRFSSRTSVVPADPSAGGLAMPSIDLGFESAAAHHGASAVAVLLSGMGKDGAAGLAKLRDAGALTIVQQPETCAVGSMPSAAIERDAACEVLEPSAISALLGRTLAVR